MRLILPILIALLLAGCRQSAEPPYTSYKSATADSAMVATAHPLATEVGLDIMRKGGNAVDAAVAVNFALAVVYPRAGNIGGGGFMMYRAASGEVAALDYREAAPAAATRDMYLDSNGNIIEGKSRYGHAAVGVPGTVAGLLAAHKRYGSMPLRELMAPSIRLAREGVRLTQSEADKFNQHSMEFVRYNTVQPDLVRQWYPGDRWRQPELAATLERIITDGKAGFYQGRTAELIAAEMQRGEGLITLEDLANYRAKWREPIKQQYKQYTIYSMPPPSSGGVALAQLLQLVEPYPLADYGYHSARSIHLLTEAERRVYADRATWLGDSDFYPVPVDSLLSPRYLVGRMSDYNPMRASTSADVRAGEPLALESEETTHFSIVDAMGNAVSITTTLNSNYGSKVMVDGAGFFLNNEMDDFSAKPGTPNQFGLVGGEANAIAPGKRMLSSMTPTIVTRGDSLYLVVGTPGGSTIITSVYQVFLNVAEYGLNIDQAVQRPRFHHQWLPDELYLEEGDFGDALIDSLERMGHTVVRRGSIGRVEAILRQPDGTLRGAADRRGDDSVMGY